MNWHTFQTNSQAPEKAFESLCNQLFENWCKETYNGDISYFTALNGAGGDGGVESYAILKNNSIIGLQAKWFPNVIEATHITQIKNSINTALKLRPNIKKYIVCVPRNLASKTGRNKKNGSCEEQRWLDLVVEINKKYPNLELILWNEQAITIELQNDSSTGILRYWFQNSQISYEKLKFAFERSKQSWLSTKYAPELNCVGKIYKKLYRYLGNRKDREKLVVAFSKIYHLASQIEKSSSELIQIIKETTVEAQELKDDINEIIIISQKLKASASYVLDAIKNEAFSSFDIDFEPFFKNFKSMAENISHSYLLHKCSFHVSAVTKFLNALTEFDYYELISEYQESSHSSNIIFRGEPGSGKTHGIASIVDSVLQDKYHAAIVIQARDIEASKTWKDILISNLGLSNSWEEEELWQALISMVNINKLSNESTKQEIKIIPKVLIAIDGVDESSTIEKWAERVKETVSISNKYPQIIFCFTTRPSFFKKEISGIQKEFISENGNVSATELFEKYIKYYNVNITNKTVLKYSLTTPLSLKLFCELYQDKTLQFNDKSDVSLPKLLTEKISLIDAEFANFAKTNIKNQYILQTIKVLAEWFIVNHSIEYNELVDMIKNKLSIENSLSTNIIEYLEKYGILNCYCEHSNDPFEGKKYIYSTGIQSYFDHAMTINVLNRYDNPSEIDFNDFKYLGINALYSLAVVSIISYDYLITQNQTLGQVVDESTLAEIQYWALRHSPDKVAITFVDTIMESMKKSSNLLYIATNRIILPLARNKAHPLGVSLLNKYLESFDKPAKRDLFWSPIGYLKDSYGKRWSRNSSLELEDYPLNQDDTADGLPTIYAWALSTLNNSLREFYRNELMKWAIQKPIDFFNLFVMFSNVNDAQILTDLFSILMCLVYEINNVELTTLSFDWVSKNILSKSKIDSNRSIAIRYYSIAIVHKAVELSICDASVSKNFLPPYSANNNYIKISKEALAGTRMGGYKGITYDLSRYVLIDHIDGDFNKYNRKNNWELKHLLSSIKENLDNVEELDFEKFILSVAFAYITDMGWNEENFRNYNLDKKTGKAIGGIDCAIAGTYFPADHGSQSNVMTVCEKYVWLARDIIYGFLSDRLNYAETNKRICDYGMIQDFIIPIQSLSQINPENTPDNNPWHIPEKKILDELECKSAEDVISLIKKSDNADWIQWLCINNYNKYKIPSRNVLSLYNFSCFEGENIETCLFINSAIIDKRNISKFIEYLQTDDNYSKISHIDDLSGGIETDCYITPKECCWFSSWKKHYEPYVLEDFSAFNLCAAIDKGCWSHKEYSDIHYHMPSIHIRKMLNIKDSDGYIFYDECENIKAEYTITGKLHHTYQEQVLVDKKEILSLLEAQGKTLIWFMREYRRESGKSREKYGDFYIDKNVLNIGYFDNNSFVECNLNTNIDGRKSDSNR